MSDQHFLDLVGWGVLLAERGAEGVELGGVFVLDDEQVLGGQTVTERIVLGGLSAGLGASLVERFAFSRLARICAGVDMTVFPL